MLVVNKKIQIPLELLDYIQEQGLVTAFMLFMYMKCMSSGKILKQHPILRYMGEYLGIKDIRTVNKHLEALRALNWVGYNPESEIYFIRSFTSIRKKHGFKKRTAATFHFEDLKNLQAFIAGAIITNNIKAQKFCRGVENREGERFATINKGVANQDHVPISAKPLKPYFGIGVYKIAELLHCKHTRAGELKHEAAKAGFIKTKKKFRELYVFDKANSNWKKGFEYAYPEQAKKIKFRRVVRNGQVVVVMKEQLHDEIIPMMDFKRIGNIVKRGKKMKWDKNHGFKENSNAKC